MKKISLLLLLALPIAMFAQTKIACVGNSITYGVGIKDPLKDAYPVVLGRMLGDTYETKNFGFSGATLLRKGNRPYWLTDTYFKAKAYKPDIVVIKLGSNDSKPVNKAYWYDYKNDLSDLIDTFRMLPSHPKIYLCYPAPAVGIGNFGITDSIITSVIIPQIKEVATKKNTELIDLHTALQGHDSMFVDRIHPNAGGAALIAMTVYKAITGTEGVYVPQAYPGKKTSWQGADRYDFVYGDVKATIVAPANPVKGNPWIFRPAFFGAFANADAGLVAKGWTIAYLDLTNRYGSRGAQGLFSKFYNYLVKSYSLSAKVTLEGLSRGGLFCLNWAASNPDKVASIYLDAPVCDITSWPGRKQAGLWKDMLKEYNIADTKADAYNDSMLATRVKIAKARIPVLIVAGNADTVVPYTDNAEKLRDLLVANGGNVKVILKPGIGHHPHGLVDSTPIIQFVLNHNDSIQQKRYINYRGDLSNAKKIFENRKTGRVAFFGGSITEMKGWHNLVMEELRQRFPNTKFDFIEAGIGSTGTTPHSFRYKKDVLKNGKVDLLFIEGAVNDFSNGFSKQQQIRGMEGVVRQARLDNPNIDIVMMHFITDPFIPLIQADSVPEVIQSHDSVAAYYQVPSINLAKEVALRIKAGEFDWKTFGGIHPAPFGHYIYAGTINKLFDSMWSVPTTTDTILHSHAIPSQPIDKFSYYKGHLVDVTKASLEAGWGYDSVWKPKVKGSQRKQYTNVPMIEATTAGSDLSFAFKGTAIGLYMTPGPDAGIIEYSIDGGEYKKYDPFTSWSKGLYIPWLHVLEAELKDKKHKLKLRLTDSKNAAAVAAHCQIYYFAVNGDE